MRRSLVVLCLLLLCGCVHQVVDDQHEENVVTYVRDAGGTNELDNLDYDLPCRPDIIIDREGFACGYSKEKRQPLWVSYRLTIDEVTNHVARRSDKFSRDLLVALDTSAPEDYQASGYDRGHIAPAADMAWSRQAMKASFFMTNMSPQVPMFNRGIWRKLETWVREEAIRSKSLFIFSGPIFSTNGTPTCIGADNQIEVPVAYYKAIVAETDEPRMIGFILANEPSTNSLYTFSCTVDQVEAVTGYDFFRSVDPDIQSNLGSKVDIDLWHLK